MDRGALWAAIHGVAKNLTWLHFHFSLSCIGEGNGNPLQCSCLENPRDGGAWWSAIMGSHRVGDDWRDLAAAAAAASLGSDAKDIMGKENTEGKKPNKGLSLGVPLVIIEALFCCSSSETKCRTYLWTIALTLQLFQPSLSGASTLLQPRKPLGKENRCLRKRLLGVWELITEAEGKFWVG